MNTPQVSQQRPEDENLGIGANMAYGLQHVLTMYGGIVAVPLIVGQAAGLSPAEIGLLIAASLFAGGLATLLQTLGVPFFGCKLPLVQGVSFAGVSTMVAIVTSSGEGGFQSVLGAVIVASLIGLLITPVFSRITKFFPPLVTGIVITTIGLTLMPVAARWAMGGNSHAPDFGSMQNIGLAAVTLVLVLLFGALTLGLHDERFIKWKPTFLYLGMSVALAVALRGWNKNLLQMLLGSHLKLPDPVWHRLNIAWIVYFVFMAASNAYVAALYSTDTWVNFKLWGYVFPLVFIVGQGFYISRYLKDEQQP